jgi:GNAT superfamily N-acetyltransferase
MIIRKMLKDDISDLAKLYKQFWGEDSSMPEMQRLFEELRDNPNYIILNAVKDGRVIGSITGIICYKLYGPCGPFMVLENFIIDSENRREGIGRSLFLEIEKYAVGKDCSHILLITENIRRDAISFYKKMGFNSDSHKGFLKNLK